MEVGEPFAEGVFVVAADEYDGGCGPKATNLPSQLVAPRIRQADVDDRGGQRAAALDHMTGRSRGIGLGYHKAERFEFLNNNDANQRFVFDDQHGERTAHHNVLHRASQLVAQRALGPATGGIPDEREAVLAAPARSDSPDWTG